MFSTIFGACRCERPKPGNPKQSLPENITKITKSTEFGPHRDGVMTIAAAGKTLLTGCGAKDKTVRAYDIDSGNVKTMFNGHKGGCTSIHIVAAFAFTASEDHTVKQWNNSGRCLQTLSAHTDAVNCVKTRGMSLVFSASSDKLVKSWDCQTAKHIRDFAGHTDCVRSLAIGEIGCQTAGLIISGGDDAEIRVWDERSSHVVFVGKGHSAPVQSVAVYGNTVYSGSRDRSIVSWDSRSWQKRHEFHGHDGWVNSVACDHDGRHIISASEDRTIRIWDLSTTECTHVLTGHTSAVTSVAAGDDGMVFSGSEDETARQWNLADASKKK